MIPLFFPMFFSDEGNSSAIGTKYALFAIGTESEALEKLRGAYSDLYQNPSKLIEFNKDGGLVRRIEEEGFFGRIKIKEEVDESILISRFLKEQLLKIKMYDDEMKPIDTNIMLARYLSQK